MSLPLAPTSCCIYRTCDSAQLSCVCWGHKELDNKHSTDRPSLESHVCLFFLYFVAAYADFTKTYQKPWHKESFWTRKENISHLLYLICIKFSVNCQLRSIALDQRCLIISFSFIRDPVPLTRLMAWILSFSLCQRICSLR